MEFSTNKITPNDNVKIPSMNGNNSGYQLDSELREYVQAGVSGVTEQYSNLSTYAYGKRLKHEGVEYRCIVPVETPENFDPDKWVKVDLTELDKRVLANADAINAIIGTIYPVGSIYLTMSSVNPSSLFGGSWERLSAGYALWTASSGAGNTISASLPNIKGEMAFRGANTSSSVLITGQTGAFSDTAISTDEGAALALAGGAKDNKVVFDAHDSNSIYKDSATTVQPPAIKVYAWKRTA